MRVRTRLAIAAAALAAAIAPGVAQAAPDTVVNFDDLPTGTAPGHYYENTAGVQFGIPADFGLPAYGTDRCTSEPDSIAAGISGKSLTFGCYTGGELGSWVYQAAINFLEERRAVSFRLRSPDDRTGPVTIKLIRDNGSVTESKTVNLPAGQIVPVSFTHATPDIDVVVLTAPGDSYVTLADIQLDDLRAPKDDVPPPPKFAVGLTQTSIDVPEQGTAQTKISIRRINGSTGPVTLAVNGLPGGIAATKIDPNPATGTNPPVLSITAGGPASGDRQVTVTASGSATAGTNVSQPIAQTAHIVPALEMPDSLAERSAGAVAGCASTYTQYIHLHGNYSGLVHAHATLISGPVTLPTPDVNVTANGEGSLAFPLALTQPLGKAGDSYVHMTFTAPGITSQGLDVRVNAGPSYVPTITNAFSYGWSNGFSEQWLPESTPGPHDTGGGNQIQVEGNFPGGCTYAFQDDLGQSLKVVKIETGRHVNEENEDGGVVRDLPDRAILQLPDDPRSTAVKEVSGPFGTSTKITLRTFRNSWGFNGVNSGEGAGTTDFSWSDFLRTFGSDDGDACVPILGCVRDPVALIAWHFISNKIEGQKGICFGWATMALRFERGIERPTDYQPGARYSYDISNPEKEGPAIKSQLIRWQASQQDMGWQEYKDGLKDHTPSLQEFHNQLRDALRANDAVTLALYQGDGGHAVDAYDMKDLGGGSFEIKTYNPNWPYLSGEETNKTTRDDRTRLNTITVGPNNGQPGGGVWVAYVDDDKTPWVGGLDKIEIYNHLPPSNADLPTDPQRWLIALANWATAGAPAGSDPTRVEQITVDGKDALQADGEATKGSGVRDQITPGGGASDIGYELKPGHTYDLTLSGSRGGRYSEGLMGGHAIATVSTARGAGKDDHVTITPGQAQIGLAAGGSSTPATFDLAAHVGHGVSRAVEATLSAGAGRGDTLALGGGSTVTLQHTGAPTSVALTLTTAGTGTPGSVTTAPMRVAAGQKLAVKPAWSNLAAGASYTVKDKHGRVVRSGRVALRASNRVRLGRGLRATVTKGRVTVRGQITKAGATPLLLVTAQAVRGAKVLSTTSVTKRGAHAVHTGRFSVGMKLRKLPRGAKVKVTVTLIDEGANLATVRATTTAR